MPVTLNDARAFASKIQLPARQAVDDGAVALFGIASRLALYRGALPETFDLDLAGRLWCFLPNVPTKHTDYATFMSEVRPSLLIGAAVNETVGSIVTNLFSEFFLSRPPTEIGLLLSLPPDWAAILDLKTVDRILQEGSAIGYPASLIKSFERVMGMEGTATV